MPIHYNDELKNVKDMTDAREHVQPFDVVILDYKMPKMDSLEVAKEINSINPHQRIIIASSYSRDIFQEAAKHYVLPLEVLEKPFSGETLVNMLNDKKIYNNLKEYAIDTELLRKAKLSHEQLKDIENMLGKQELYDKTEE
jgi:DNA-binding NtrC family response regulator